MLTRPAHNFLIGLAMLAFAGSVARGTVFTNVPEAVNQGFQVVYEMAIPNAGNFRDGNPVPYSVNNSGSVGLFDRVAIYLEVDTGSGLEWVYTSMDAYTNDRVKLGLPHNVSNPVKWQQNVTKLNVFSNKAGIVTGTGITTGNIEVWPSNYAPGNTAGVPGASGTTFDFGDGSANTSAGYGSFQVHNYGALGGGQTLIAYNRWGTTGVSNLGIGNNPGTIGSLQSGSVTHPDWTFQGSADQYTIKNLSILVRPTNIAISNGLEHAVFQRDAMNMADIPIEGIFTTATTHIEARAVPRAGFTGTPTGWQVIDGAPAGGTYAGSLGVKGGWYDIEVRAFNGAMQVGQAKVSQVGVGEVFITAGQSNSANHGDNAGASNPQAPMDERVSTYTGSQWRFATDPQPIATGGSGSPWPHLGDLLVAQLDVPVGFYNVGWGGTSVGQWLPGAPGPDTNPLYNRLAAALGYLGTDGFRAVLWHQGESDAGSTSTANYAARLQQLIDASRVDAGFDVPWGVALVSYRPGAGTDQNIIDAQLQVIASDPLVFLGASTDDMIIPYRGGVNYTGIHFNAAGLDEHARRWLESIDAYFTFPAAEPAVPEPTTLAMAMVGMIVIGGRRRRA